MLASTRTAVVALALVAAGCSANARPRQPTEEPETTLRIENQSRLDMNIYVLRGSQRIRLGTAAALGSTSFTVPRDIMSGITVLQFMADPIGGTGSPVTNELAVTPGEEVLMTIPSGSVALPMM